MFPTIEKLRKNAYVLFVTISCCLAFTSLGGALSWASPSLVKLQALDSPIPLTENQASLVGSFLAIGAILIAIPYTCLFNTVGRKWLIVAMAALYIAGWLVLIFAKSVASIYVGRFLLGCAVGPTYGIIPVYLAEVVSKSIRGSSVAILVISQSIGALIQYGCGPILSFQTHNAISIIFPVCLIIFSVFLPETPFYLLSINKEEEAKSVLMKLRGETSESEVKEEFEAIRQCLRESPPMSYKQLGKELALPKTNKIIAIIVVSTFAQQYSGVGAIIVYMEKIFKDMNTPIAPKNAVMVTEALADVTVLVTFLIIDRVGRKPLLLLASLVCLAADILIGIYFFLREDDIISESYSWVGMMGVFLVQIGYGMGLGPVPLLVMSEVMSFSLKGWISGFYLIAQGIFNATAIQVFQSLDSGIGNYYAYWIFAACILISISFLMLFMPETKGKSLVEIQYLLSNKQSSNSDVISNVACFDIEITNNTNDSILVKRNGKIYDLKM